MLGYFCSTIFFFAFALAPDTESLFAVAAFEGLQVRAAERSNVSPIKSPSASNAGDAHTEAPAKAPPKAFNF
jgi:hypothetical protein